MTLLYKPLEEILTRLALCIKKDDARCFEKETINFYQALGKLSIYNWMPQERDRLVNYYQNKYDQLKMQMGISGRRAE